jgi:hypothetical protein
MEVDSAIIGSQGGSEQGFGEKVSPGDTDRSTTSVRGPRWVGRVDQMWRRLSPIGDALKVWEIGGRRQ